MKKILVLSLLLSLTALSSIKSMDQQKGFTPAQLKTRIARLENEVIEGRIFFKKINLEKLEEAANIFTQNEIIEAAKPYILESIEWSFLMIIENIKSNLNRIKPDQLKSIQNILNKVDNDVTDARTRHTEEIKENIEEILNLVEEKIESIENTQEGYIKAITRKLGTPVLKLIKTNLNLLQKSIPLHGLKQLIDKNIHEGFKTLTENGKSFILFAIIIYAEFYGITKVLQMLGLTDEQFLCFIYSAPYEFIKENLIILIAKFTNLMTDNSIVRITPVIFTGDNLNPYRYLKEACENGTQQTLITLAQFVKAKLITRSEWYKIAKQLGFKFTVAQKLWSNTLTLGENLAYLAERFVPPSAIPKFCIKSEHYIFKFI